MTATKKTDQANSNNTPDFIVYRVEDRGRGRRAQWTSLGAAWMHEDGNGFNIQLRAMPLNFDGNLTARVPLSTGEA